MKRSDAEADNLSQLPSLMIRVDEIPGAGLESSLTADVGECKAIADALELVSLDRLTFTYALKRQEGARVRLKGRLQAACEQRCVVTLDPVGAEISEEVEIDFWPPDQLLLLEEQAGDDMVDIPLEGPEPIVDGAIDLGHLAYEILASNLEPFPRKTGASFAWEGAEPSPSTEPGGPFAALQALRKNRK